MKLNVITNSRPTKNLGTTLVVSCTLGQIKISPDFAEELKLVEGDKMGVGKDGDGNIFVFKGNDKVGGKLAKSGNYLQMSSANAWEILGGDENKNRSFAVTDTIEDEDGKFLKVEFSEEEFKAGYNEGDEKEEDVSTTKETGKVETETVEEETTDADKFEKM